MSRAGSSTPPARARRASGRDWLVEGVHTHRIVGALALAAALGTPGGCGWDRRERTRGPGASPPEGEAGTSGQFVYEREVGGNLDLYVIPVGGGLERRLTDDPAEDALARWTPDGRRIVFSSQRSGSWQLWEIAAEGGQPRRLRTNAATEYQSDPSPTTAGSRSCRISMAPSGCSCSTGRAAPCGSWSATEGGPSSATPAGAPTEGPSRTRPTGTSGTRSTSWTLRPGRSGACRAPRPAAASRASTGTGAGWSTSAAGTCDPPPAWSNTIWRRGRSGRSSAWPALDYDPVYSPDGTELAFASNITGEWAIYRQRLSDARAWRVTFGPGPARSPDYRPATR